MQCPFGMGKSVEFHRNKKCAAVCQKTFHAESVLLSNQFFTAQAVVFTYGIIIKNSNMLDLCYLHLTPPDDDHYFVSSALGHIIFVEGVLGHGLFNILIGFL